MKDVRQTPEFEDWLNGLRDNMAKTRIAVRIARVEAGLMGDCEPVGGGVSELKIDYGPGYRLYFVQRGEVIIILLCGGDKKTQKRDIQKAKKMAEEI